MFWSSLLDILSDDVCVTWRSKFSQNVHVCDMYQQPMLTIGSSWSCMLVLQYAPAIFYLDITKEINRTHILERFTSDVDTWQMCMSRPAMSLSHHPPIMIPISITLEIERCDLWYFVLGMRPLMGGSLAIRYMNLFVPCYMLY